MPFFRFFKFNHLENRRIPKSIKLPQQFHYLIKMIYKHF